MTASRLDRTLDTIWGGLALLGLGFAPLFIVPTEYNPFVPPKEALIASVAVLGLLLATGKMLAGRRVALLLRRPTVWTLVFLLWNLLLWPLARSRSLAMERVAWLWLVFAAAWMWQEWARAKRSRILATLRVLAAAAFLTSLWALYQDLSAKWGPVFPASIQRFFAIAPRLTDWRGFISAGLGNTDHIAAFLAVLYLPFLFAMLHARRRRGAAMWMIVLWTTTATMIVCWSVGANGALLLGALVVLFGIGRKRRAYAFVRRGLRLAVWAAGCAAIVLWLVVPTPLNPHRPGIFQEAFSSQRWIEGGPTRAIIWLNALETVRRHQLFGVGPGCLVYAFPSMQSAFVPDDPEWLAYQGLYTNAAHNTLLQTWAELGPVGALLLIAMVVAAFRALSRPARRGGWMEGWIAWGAIAALAVMVLTSLMTFPLVLPVSTFMFFCLIALSGAADDWARDEREFRMPSLVFQERWGEIALDLRGMKRVEAVEGAFHLPRPVAGALFVLAAAGAVLWIAHVWKPAVSDTVYNRARAARQAGSLDEADRLHRRALEIWPRHHDCRSAYSSFLLDQGRYRECIDELEIVFRRLDSPELYLRRADAWEGLGQTREARRDVSTYLSRVPIAREDVSPRAEQTP
ncbi:O-antigen ligase family protein [Candidatus Sumerlaeota bacterium]|nr:O-antigen ligase family protein [Candidatus Sumerlaeota bacterium]